jgi:hypothetical protein
VGRPRIDKHPRGRWFVVTGGEGWIVTNTAALALDTLLPQ